MSQSGCECVSCDARLRGRLLSVGQTLTAGFGFKAKGLSGSLTIALLLNATLVFNPSSFYKRAPAYNLSGHWQRDDELLGLANALPTEDLLKACPNSCYDTIILTSSSRPNSGLSTWWQQHGANMTGVVSRLRTGRRHLMVLKPPNGSIMYHGHTMPFVAGYAFTEDFFRNAWLRGSIARRDVWPLFRPGYLNVALHVRNGDRLPGRAYERAMYANLPDLWYEAAISSIERALLSKTPRENIQMHVVAFGSGVGKGLKFLPNASGEPSELPNFLKQSRGVASHKISLDGDFRVDLSHMARADVLVAAASSFSLLAMALTRSIVIGPHKPDVAGSLIDRTRAQRCYCWNARQTTTGSASELERCVISAMASCAGHA